MGITRGPKIIRNGLVLALDAADKDSQKSFPSFWKNIVDNSINPIIYAGCSFNGANGGSLVFDGVEGVVARTPISSFNVGCIDIWFKPSSLITFENNGPNGAGFTLLQLRNSAFSNDYWHIVLGNINSFTNEYITVNGVSNGYGISVTDGGSLAANQWFNLVVNWESSTYKIYLNNINKTTSSFGTVTQLTNPNIIWIGAMRIDTNSFTRDRFAGSINAIKIYNRGLTKTEIIQNYNALKSRFGL